MAGGWLRCRACRKQTSLTAGTIFEGTRKPFADVVSGDVVRHQPEEAAAGYQHQVTVLSGGSDPAHEVMPRVHLVASLLKRWLIGTHQGGVQHQGLLFHRLAQQALAVGPAPYNAIVKPPGSSDSRTTGQ